MQQSQSISRSQVPAQLSSAQKKDLINRISFWAQKPYQSSQKYPEIEAGGGQ